ncbi:MAG: ABC transporter permease subunit [Candidatus Coatesbacteria bacterium]|nr:ABC transporter permease subunit [Candidatus Coatesbacteria bacterium]
MRKIAVICAKELRVYFGSIAGYLIVTAFLAMSGIAFFHWTDQYRTSSMRPIFQIMAVLVLLTAPAITMRLLAGEFSSKTSDLLFTSRITPLQIILGKFLFCVCVLIVMLVCTCQFPLLLLKYGSPDMGQMLSGYIGLILAGSLFCAIGLFASSTTSNTAIAAVIAIGILLGLFLLPSGGQDSDTAIAVLSPFTHFGSFAKGVFDTADAAYFILGALAFVLATTQVLRLRRRS